MNSQYIRFRFAVAVAAALALSPVAAPARSAGDASTPASTIVHATSHSFEELVGRLERAVGSNGMGIVARASASAGAAARGVQIRGNLVLMVFRNDYAVRMLNASVPAGIEAPLRLYVTESEDATASVSYRAPSTVFASYRNDALDALAAELDRVFAKIVRDALGN